MTGAGIILAIVAAVGLEYYADPVRGNDNHDGRTAACAFRTLRRATAALKAGDALNLAAGAVFRESLMLPDGGTAAAPIIIRGNGAVITGLEPIPDGEWIDQGRGVFHHPNSACWGALQPRVIDCRGRDVTVASGRRVTRDPGTLNPGEALWNTKGIWYRVEDGRTPTGLSGTFRESGVKATGQSHVVVEGLVAERFANDGFNIHGSSHDLVFRRIEARGNGDDGFSVHEDSETQVRGGWFHHNADGIADVHASQTSYSEVLVESNELFGVGFYGGLRTMRDSIVRGNGGKEVIIVRDADHGQRHSAMYTPRVYFRGVQVEGGSSAIEVGEGAELTITEEE